MTPEFVPYEQALALKELGFNEGCAAYYQDNPHHSLYGVNLSNETYIRAIEGCDMNTYGAGQISAPLYQQAFRFFREKHNLKAWVQEHTKGKFIYEIRPHVLSDYRKGEIYVFKSYEKTELACLNKLIEITKNK